LCKFCTNCRRRICFRFQDGDAYDVEITGRVGHLADKYQAQMIRYRTILQGLFGERPVECYLLFTDEPYRIVTV
jgi:hypothetical protein